MSETCHGPHSEEAAYQITPQNGRIRKLERDVSSPGPAHANRAG